MRKLEHGYPAFVTDAGAECFGPQDNLPDPAVLAVSGGGDSMALLRLAHVYWSDAGKKVIALTVDHGLRPESANEAEQVAIWCRNLGIEHHTLHWHYDGKGNLSAAAREGRYRVMADFCDSRGARHLYTGHTMDDQAETVLMRFARGSGVDGLSGMAREKALWGLSVIRPFVETRTRDALRDVLKAFRQSWLEDPTNDNSHYDRVKARRLFSALEPLGLGTQSLTALARRMRFAKEVLQDEAESLAEKALDLSPLGYAILDSDALAAARTETACRLIGQTLEWFTGGSARPRFSVEESLLKWALKRESCGGKTHSGCIFRPKGRYFMIMREVSRCAGRTEEGGISGIWDERFDYVISPQNGADRLHVQALGEAGLFRIKESSDVFTDAWICAPREVKLTAPALWQGGTLLSVPFAPWSAEKNSYELNVKACWSK